ncbi:MULTISPECIES: NUDIX domain-containing protein [Lactobacillus]|uniref:NUDIX hydrolase n=1 Tax=Lactobacillus xujianguonis TaxID=2495899 RepID=A0A437SUH6_9LACO|nr:MULTISPECIES: NUDIX hydrolase [Lactobacillus]RVU70593.1 NUDIX hydrolase [Lactobacillus xujianguonis]RVU73782.1 NUDIX hydrolase [Lactobacillus xujianguonis]
MQELKLELTDHVWPLTYIDHDRKIVRAIVFDKEKNFYFVTSQRDDEFGKVTLIEISGGGVEAGEDLESALKRELKDELGAQVKIITKIGVVSDYYNVIHRHNLNNYYLVQALSFGEKHLTKDEQEKFHLSTVKLSYQEAEKAYERATQDKLGKLITARELPILRRAKELLDSNHA